jgi:hypothetical protein
MFSTDIYTILSSKPHNQHYLKRYVKFIEYCNNINTHYTGYVEYHHILPKAKTLFPEYKNFKQNPWNKIKLTPRQHFIAHWMLWKIFGGFMAYAFSIMRRKSKVHSERYFRLNSKSYGELKIAVSKSQSTRIISKETIEKMKKSQKNKPKIRCPHCDKIGDESNMRRWHFDNCKVFTGKSVHEVKQKSDIVTCPHCGKTGKEQGMLANHFSNCSVIRGDYRKVKDKIACPHCKKEGANTYGFKVYHFDNCKILTGKIIRAVEYDLSIVKCPHCDKEGTMHGMKSSHFEHCPTLKPELPKIQCPHCKKEGNNNGYFKSHHFDKCKQKI